MPAIDSEPSGLLGFLSASPSPYHAVAEVARRLRAAGFCELDERERFSPDVARAFVVRGGSSLVAFHLGRDPLAETGALMVGAHTDSPGLRLKPNQPQGSAGFVQLAVEPYGGALWYTWLDRDLIVAGRLVSKSGRALLVRTATPVATIPSLAIHLQREVNNQGLRINPQSHLSPILAHASHDDTSGPLAALLGAFTFPADMPALGPEDLAGWDLALVDAAPPGLVGSRGEFVSSRGLDNLFSVHAALSAFLRAGAPTGPARFLVLHDHEEVGSRSALGARSSFLSDVVARLCTATSPDDPEARARMLARTMFWSADMAHGVHPNHPEQHDPGHRPQLGKGPAVKINVNQSYATDGMSLAAFDAACQAAGVTPQRFSSRNDLTCGSTLGPITAARLGVRTVDAGAPMLAMHSARELAAVEDILSTEAVMLSWFRLDRVPSPRD